MTFFYAVSICPELEPVGCFAPNWNFCGSLVCPELELLWWMILQKDSMNAPKLNYKKIKYAWQLFFGQLDAVTLIETSLGCQSESPPLLDSRAVGRYQLSLRCHFKICQWAIAQHQYLPFTVGNIQHFWLIKMNTKFFSWVLKLKNLNLNVWKIWRQTKNQHLGA